MSIYFSTHKKKKIFPFALFGYAFLLVWTGLIIYLWQAGFNFSDFFTTWSEKSFVGLIGIAIIVSAFLIFLLSLGIIRELKSKFKFALYLMQFLFLIITCASGYFLDDMIFSDIIKYFFFIGAAYFIILIIYYVIQHKIYSKYYSNTIMIISATPVVPFLYFASKIIAGSDIVLSRGLMSFDNIALYALLFTMLLYDAVNSAYLSYINRRVY